ncbi:MAG: hypothetical protein GY716_04585 [bacterium]|nr:hypothetical protein [bacterium]
MERALRPGTFIECRAAWSFVRRLETVARKLDKLATSGDANAAAHLYETFIGACHEKVDEVDDSSGSFASLVQSLFAGWTRARQIACADAGETAEILAAWYDDDRYGFCLRLERELTKVMDERHLAEFASAARERLDRAASDDGGAAGYPRRRWSEVLKHILATQGDIGAYLALCEASVLTSSDCCVLVGISERNGSDEEALGWVERGLDLCRQETYAGGAEYDLKKRQRELLQRLGRLDDAIAVAWTDFEEHPTRTRYEMLMEVVPDDRRSRYRNKAVERAEHADLPPAIELFVETSEFERLARALATTSDSELIQLSHTVTEPAANALSASHPGVAARVYLALAVRILDSRRSKYYGVALAHLQRARDRYEAAGQVDAWSDVVQDLRATHRRKVGFMRGLERVVAGLPAREPRPSFVDQARNRWNR